MHTDLHDSHMAAVRTFREVDGRQNAEVPLPCNQDKIVFMFSMTGWKHLGGTQ